MINELDFQNLKESFQIEGKKATNSVPKSMWETYSAFANTLGGTIILGVEEQDNGTLIPTGIENPDILIKDIWSTLNNHQKVSMNILTEQDIEKVTVHGKDIIVIYVPMAPREYKPVYINNNQTSGTYRRNGDGDYHCSTLEINNMLRDQTEITQDYSIVSRYDIHNINKDTLSSYRNRFNVVFHDHPWTDLDDEQFLYRISAIEINKDQDSCLTEAGLLMFGNDYEIERIFPDYFLDYREMLDDHRWSNRIHSGDGRWSGNLYDFFFKIMNELKDGFKVPFSLNVAGERIDEVPVISAIREAFINCIGNANFYDAYGLVILRYPNKLIFENPGILRMPLEKVLIGGNSDPRNKAIMKMFSLIGYGERAGSGIPNIFSIWKKEHWPSPQLIQEFNHDRTKLILQYLPKNLVPKSDFIKLAIHEDIIQYVMDHTYARTKDIAELLNVKDARARQLLKELCDQDILEAIGANKNRYYKLKA